MSASRSPGQCSTKRLGLLPSHDAQDDCDQDRVVELACDGDEVWHQVERHRQICDERGEQELVATRKAPVARKTREEDRTVGHEPCKRPRIAATSTNRQREHEQGIKRDACKDGSDDPLERDTQADPHPTAKLAGAPARQTSWPVRPEHRRVHASWRAYDAAMWADWASRLSLVAVACAATSCRDSESGATADSPRHTTVTPVASTTGSSGHVIANASDPTGDYGKNPAIDMVAGKVVQAPHRIKVTITLARPIDYASISPESGLSFGVLLSDASAQRDFAWVEIHAQNDTTFHISTVPAERRKRITGFVRGNVIRLALPRPARDYIRATFLSETALSADSMQ